MDEATVRVFWSPTPPAHAVTSVAVDVDRAWLYTGGTDGAIIRWQLDAAIAPKACVMLVGHTRAIHHLAAGLQGSSPPDGDGDGDRYLLSVDEGGGCCLWREPCGRCVARRWIPQLGAAVFFAQTPPQDRGNPAAAKRLLAVLPAGSEGPTLTPHSSLQHYNREHAGAVAEALWHPRGDGPRNTVDRSTVDDSRLATQTARPPPVVMLVIDWRCLILTHVLPMKPLQQLVCVDPPMPEVCLSSSGNGGNGGGGGGGGDSFWVSRRLSTPAAPCAENTDGGVMDRRGAASTILCFQWACHRAALAQGKQGDQEQRSATPAARVAPGPVVGGGRQGGGGGRLPPAEMGAATLSSCDKDNGGPSKEDSVAVAVAVTSMGILYGCRVPYDLCKPQGWVLGGCGRGESAPVGAHYGECSVGMGTGTGMGMGMGAAASPGEELDVEGGGLQGALLDLHGPLLVASVTSDLRWALLGAMDAWIVLEARWDLVSRQHCQPATSSAADGPGVGSHRSPQRSLDLCYTARCRISLMHQPLAGGLRTGLNVLGQARLPQRDQPRPQVLRTAGHLLLLNSWEDEFAPAAASMAAVAGERAEPAAELAAPQQHSGPYSAAAGPASASPPDAAIHPTKGHPAHDNPRRGVAVLQALSWDGTGRQQVVSMTSDGRILSVQELTAESPAIKAVRVAPAEGRSLSCTPTSSTTTRYPPGLQPPTGRVFCCHLPAENSIDLARHCSSETGHIGNASRIASGLGGWGWVLGVHTSYQQGLMSQGTAFVLKWPLPSIVPEATAPSASAVKALARSPASVAAQLVGSLHDGWAGAAAAWRAHTSRRRCALRRPPGDAVTRGFVVRDSVHEDSAHTGRNVRYPVHRYGRYDAVRGYGCDDVSSDSAGDDVVRDIGTDQVRRRRVSGEEPRFTKQSRCGDGFSAAAAGSGGLRSDVAASTTDHITTAAAAAAAAVAVPAQRVRRCSSGGQGGVLPACLYERWDASRRDVYSSYDTAKARGVLMTHWNCEEEQEQELPSVRVAGGGGDDLSASAVTTVLSTSLLTVYDGTAAVEAVVLHCTAEGAMHYCDAGAYAVPSVHWQPAAEGAAEKGRELSGELLADLTHGGGEDTSSDGGDLGKSCWPAAAPTASDSARPLPPPALVRPGRAGSMRGHIGPVTCQLEVQMTAAPGRHATAAEADKPPVGSSHASPSSPSSLHLVDEAVAASGDAASSGSGKSGGPVRILLTGGFDGSLRGWHTYAAAFGRPAFALHPHGAAVRRVLLPRGAGTHAAPEFRRCVVSAAEDGSVALVCIERGCVVRVCRTYPYGMPEVVSWSFRRGFLACGGRDPQGQWAVAVFDIAPAAPSLDRVAVGPEAAAILDGGPLLSAPRPMAVGLELPMPARPGRTHADGSDGRTNHQQYSQRHHASQHSTGVLQLYHLSHQNHQNHLMPNQTHHIQQEQPLQQTRLTTTPMYDNHSHVHVPTGNSAHPIGRSRAAGQSSGGLAHWSSSSSSYLFPPPAALVAASSSSPCLAPVWAYGGSLRTLQGPRTDVLIAAINSEALLSAMVTSASATTQSASTGGTSSPVPMPPPRRGTRGLAAGRSSPGQPPYGLSPTHGAPSPVTAFTLRPSVSPCASQRASLDLRGAAATTAAAVPADGATSVVPQNNSVAAMPLTAARVSRGGGVSRFSLEVDRSVGDGSACGASAGGSGRPSLDEPSTVSIGIGGAAAAADVSGMRTLAALISMLHPWMVDPRVDKALEELLSELGILHKRDTNSRIHENVDDCTAASGVCPDSRFATAAAHLPPPHPPVPRHRAHSAPAGQVCGCDGCLSAPHVCRLGHTRNGSGGSGGSTGSAQTAASEVAAGMAPQVVGLSAGCSPQARAVPVDWPPPLLQPRCPGPDLHTTGDEPYGSYKPCLVQPALLSSCGSVALAMPQAAEPRGGGADRCVIGDPVTAATRLLHIVSLGGGLEGSNRTAAVPFHDGKIAFRAAIRAASQVRHLSLITARDAVALERVAAAAAAAVAAAVAAVQLPSAPVSASLLTHRVPRLLEPDLAVFARRWLAGNPRVREAAQLLLSAYTKPCPVSPDVAAGALAAVPHVAVTSPWSVVLPYQAMQLLQLRQIVPKQEANEPQQTAAATIKTVLQQQQRRGSFDASAVFQLQSPPPPLPLNPQRLYPTAIIAAAACLAHPDTVPRDLFAAAVASLVDLLCLPLTIPKASAASGWGDADVRARPPMDTRTDGPHPQQPQPSPSPSPSLPQLPQVPQAQQHVSELWAEGHVLLPGLAAVMLTAALMSTAVERWREQLQPWGRFVDKLLNLVHAIPWPPTGAKGGQCDTSTAPRAAQQLANQTVKLLAATAALDLEAVLEGLGRLARGQSLPLHALVAAALTRLASTRSGRCCLAAAAPALGAFLVGCASAPAARGRPDLARPAYLAAADLAAVLPCTALHAGSMQLAVAPPLSTASPSGEPQYVTVYDIEYGNATWQLPLQPGPDALQPLPSAISATLAGAGAGTSSTSTSVASPATYMAGPASAAVRAVGCDSGGAGSSAWPACLPRLLRGMAQAGVSALQFSPQGDHLAVLVVDGAAVPALLVYSLHLPWSHKLMMMPGAPRPALVVQPCLCWLLPGLQQLLHPPLPLPPSPQQQQRGLMAQENDRQLESEGVSTRSVCKEAEPTEGASSNRGLEKHAKEESEGKREALRARSERGQPQESGSEGDRGCHQGCQSQGKEDDRGVRLARVVDRALGLHWPAQSCVALLRYRTAVLGRFVLPGGA